MTDEVEAWEIVGRGSGGWEVHSWRGYEITTIDGKPLHMHCPAQFQGDFKDLKWCSNDLTLDQFKAIAEKQVADWRKDKLILRVPKERIEAAKMDEVEALARAYCAQMGLDPEKKMAMADSDYPDSPWWVTLPQWHKFKAKAKKQLAWSRAMESVKREQDNRVMAAAADWKPYGSGGGGAKTPSPKEKSPRR